MANANATLMSRRQIGWWLLICAMVVYGMIVVGGATRLTQSGLSMVEWEPVMGIVPPIGGAAWNEVFDKYKQSPEYQKVNRGMSMDEFKSIFYWEYGHRVLGRLIGFLFLLPFLYFLLRKKIPSGWHIKLFGLFVLGGLQGAMGWYMVKSGLVDVPRVSQYRLAAHFGLALLIFSFMLWYAMDFLRGDNRHQHAQSGYLNSTVLVLAVVVVMMMSGAFVAGTKAGFIMNTFPQMAGQWIPPGINGLQPAWKNIFENPVTIQFVHRCMALLVIATVIYSAIVASKQSFKTRASWVILAMILQVVLGVMALVMRVPVWLGVLHQAGAVLLLSAALYTAHRARKGFVVDSN